MIINFLHITREIDPIARARARARAKRLAVLACLSICTLAALSGCASTERLPAVPIALAVKTSVLDIPGIFPPVILNVTIDGQAYQKTHVDGGAVAQAFL